MKTNPILPLLAISLLLTAMLSSCDPEPIPPTPPPCQGINPDALAMVPGFSASSLTYADTIGNSIQFNMDDTTYFDPDCVHQINWHMSDSSQNRIIMFILDAPLPESYYLEDSTMIFSVYMDLDINSEPGSIYVDFYANRLDTATVSFTTGAGQYKYEVLSTFTTPSQTYTHVYKCTDLDAGTEPGINPDIIYFHKGTGMIAFHELSEDKNWYLQP